MGFGLGLVLGLGLGLGLVLGLGSGLGLGLAVVGMLLPTRGSLSNVLATCETRRSRPRPLIWMSNLPPNLPKDRQSTHCLSTWRGARVGARARARARAGVGARVRVRVG